MNRRQTDFLLDLLSPEDLHASTHTRGIFFSNYENPYGTRSLVKTGIDFGVPLPLGLTPIGRSIGTQ